MSDPANLEDFTKQYTQNYRLSGHGAGVVTHFPCPGCAAGDWLEFPITAALDDYQGVQDPTTCSVCGRTFHFVIRMTDGGAAGGGSTSMSLVQDDGPDPPGYLPNMRPESSGSA